MASFTLLVLVSYSRPGAISAEYERELKVSLRRLRFKFAPYQTGHSGASIDRTNSFQNI